jgi:Protein of Unknown function (DUF2784)
MLVFLDRFFFVFHTSVIAFNLFGWVWRGTRVANLAVLCATLLSWSVLGLRHGFGYCPFTDWHWRVRAALGYVDLPGSYIKLLVDTLAGSDVNARLVDTAAVILLLASLSASALTNAISWAKTRRKKSRRERP